MPTATLTERQREVLRDIVELHELHGGVEVHANVKPEEREIIQWLFVEGLVDVRPLVRGATDDQTVVVPTAKGRRMHVGF